MTDEKKRSKTSKRKGCSLGDYYYNSGKTSSHILKSHLGGIRVLSFLVFFSQSYVKNEGIKRITSFIINFELKKKEC